MAQESLKLLREPEHSHLRRFATLCSAFSTGSLDYGDKPDLIVHTDDGDSGVEHTQLFRVEAGRDIVLPQAQERLQAKVMDSARKVYEERSNVMLWLYAHFSLYNALKKRTTNEVASRLADVISHAVHAPGRALGMGHWHQLERWDYDHRLPGIFPAEIDTITFQLVDRPGLVGWGVPRGCAVPNITADYLQKKIDEKDAKLESYRARCREVWLLMVTENGVPSSYFNISTDVAEFTYQSKFDRVFYFENFDSKIVELKVAHVSQQGASDR